MRKQGERLKNVGDAPLPCGDIDCAGRIEQKIASDCDPSGIRLRQPRKTVEQRGFAGTGRSKQNGDAGRNFDGNIQNEGGRAGIAPHFADSRGEHGRLYFAVHGVHTRRFTADTTDNTANEIRSNTRAM